VLTTSMPAPGQLLLGKYRIVAHLGTGGMGDVFGAENIVTRRRVALKFIRAELAENPVFAQRLLREAQSAARVDHPNVIDVHDVRQSGGMLFLVMEHLDGEPLASRLGRERMAIRDVVTLLAKAARGVEALHAAHVLHRDLKPDNIFLVSRGEHALPEPKIIDLGIAKLLHDGTTATLTAAGALIGTPAYMSPEHLLGAPFDERCDVYALGLVLYEALTGVQPFDAPTVPMSVARTLTFEAPLPRSLRPDLSRELEAVVMAAIAREPARRIPCMTSFLRALAPFADEAQITGATRRGRAPERTGPAFACAPTLAVGACAAPVVTAQPMICLS